MPAVDQEVAPASLSELLALSPAELAAVDIGRANLLCAEGLPNAEDLDIDEHVARLDAWAERVRWMTQRHLSYFHAHPEQFENSEPRWRLLGIAKVLNQECDVSYHQERIDSEPDWTDSQDLLIHGVTGNRRKGTCASLPVVMVAIGRRLDYPMYLSTTVGHSFSRWDGLAHENESWRDKFNVEFHGDIGYNRDEYYLDWPVKWPEIPRQQWRRGDPTVPHLRSLHPAAEFAHSLCQRAVCLEAVGRHVEAINTYYACRRYDDVYGGFAEFAVRTLRSRAEEIMRSMGFDPLRLRGWLMQIEAKRLAAIGFYGVPRPPLHVTVHGSGGIHVDGASPSLTLTMAQLIRDNPFGVPPTNLDDIVQIILARTCRDTPAEPDFDLLLPHPPEPKVDPYASLRDENGKVQYEK